ncbi:MAG TPA: MerR family transcriptional regulator [Myxococcota bacterium]|mgnify:FL=1|nr:MerR family transcriptional regulator [Myxococcota bacterium]HOH75621.1 MerR family transcriptional regulator [Myxococcota bacterium]
MAFLIERPIPERPYFKVGEVAQILGVAPSTVRYWQKEFPDHIRPELSMAGQNVFSRNDVITMAVIMNLVRIDGVSLKDARVSLTRIIQEHGGKVQDIRLCRQFNLDLGLEQEQTGDRPPEVTDCDEDRQDVEPPESDCVQVPARDTDDAVGRDAADARHSGQDAELLKTIRELQREIQLLEDENIRLREQIARGREDLARSGLESTEYAARLRILQEQVYAIAGGILQSLDCGRD